MATIQCPPDCNYLVSAKTHPPATVQRQREQDARFVLPLVAGLSPQQYQLFFLVQRAIHRLAETGEPSVDDAVVQDTARALAATYETASKGIIYEHRPSSLHAERLAHELKPLLKASDGRGPVASERDLVEVFQRVERAAGQAKTTLRGNNRAYLDLVARLMQPTPGDSDTATSDVAGPRDGRDPENPRIIVP
ncbi:MAG TPA: hypothetical protein DIU48_08630 [Acidobacteria bacterium]|nr:hypothetical protein [Acidobacteriota bacterium]